MHHVDGVVDIERHRRRRRRIAGTPEIDHHPHQAQDLAQRRGVLPARQGRLRAQVRSAVGQAAAGQLEGRVAAQGVEVVGIFPAAGDGQDAGAQDVRQSMDDARRIAVIGDHRRQLVRQSQTPLGLGQQQYAAIRGEPPAIKGGDHFLAPNGWQRERQQPIVGHGGCGAPGSGKDDVSTIKSYAVSVPYATSASPKPRPGEKDGLKWQEVHAAAFSCAA